MATAPVGTTVIEDDDPDPEVVMMSEMSAKNSENFPNFDEVDFDLCEQCSKRRKERAKMKQTSLDCHVSNFFSF